MLLPVAAAGTIGAVYCAFYGVPKPLTDLAAKVKLFAQAKSFNDQTPQELIERCSTPDFFQPPVEPSLAAKMKLFIQTRLFNNQVSQGPTGRCFTPEPVFLPVEPIPALSFKDFCLNFFRRKPPASPRSFSPLPSFSPPITPTRAPVLLTQLK